MIDPSLRDLYQEVILDHGRNPRNFHALDDASHEAHGHNPLCGDRVHLYLKIGPQGRVEDAAFEGKGCAISIASASLMTILLRGKDVPSAKHLAEAFCQLAKGAAIEAPLLPEDREQIEVMAGVSQFPMRVKCATLAWHTFEAALEGNMIPDAGPVDGGQ
ncbi:MAG TPA: SUF system NifU family Fe-S cluster assembly protein [Methylocella sp.]|nr:SUF system NifU family Fe-S cluster assembly protein [Methylocella sp.]